MAVIIGKAGRRISRETALAHVAGYACYNDGSIRDWQRHTSQFAPGKNFVGTGGFGPWMVTTDEIPDISKQTIATRLNGVEVQAAPISDLVFDVPALIAYCSTFTELVPGDVIVTGTTGGVGAYRTPPLWMKEGDVVEVEISGIGILRNPVKDEVAVPPRRAPPENRASNNKNKETHHEHAKAPAADHRRRQLSAAGMAGRPRHAVEIRAAHAHACDVAAAGGTSRGSAGRRHHRRHPRHGARRHRHRDRRRNPPRKLLQPLCHRARGHRRRQSRHHHRAHRTRRRRCRASSARSAARSPVELHDMEFLRQQYRSRGQNHPARPVHDEPAGQERVLQGRRRAGDGVRRRRQRRGARPAEGRRRRDPARRALGAQQSGPRQALCGEGDQPRAAGHHRADRGASVLRLCRRGAGLDQAGRLFLPRRTRRHQRRADFDRGGAAETRSRRAEGPSSKKIMLGVLDLGNPEIETPKSSPTASATA